MNRINLFGIKIDPWTMDQTLEETSRLVASGEFAHVIGVNADKVLQIHEDSNMGQIVNNCEIVNADGISMVLAAKLFDVKIPERVTGIDYMQEVCRIANEKEWSVYLLGAKQQIVEKAHEQLQAKYPNIKFVGVRNGYFTRDQWPEIAELIVEAKPHIIFVGITSPIKEHLIEYFRDRRMNGVFVGVGGSFDVISGSISRAPNWVQKVHLEWLYRMLQEPKRLAKRYLVGNIRFIGLVVKEKFVSRKGL